MFRRTLFPACFAVALAAWGATPNAQAGDGHYGYYPGWRYSIYTTESIPYFAEHPPVYYSQPVPRPYGYSPYAYPPGVMTPEPKPQPKITINPHVKPKAKSTNVARSTTPKPLRIRNPYVDSDVQLSQTP